MDVGVWMGVLKDLVYLKCEVFVVFNPNDDECWRFFMMMWA